MSRTKRALLLAASAAAITYAAYRHQTRFSIENIEARQVHQITKAYESRKKGGERAKGFMRFKHEQLKTGLSKLEDASDEERCRFERGFMKGIHEQDDSKPSRDDKASGLCTPTAQRAYTLQTWYGGAAVLGLIISAVLLIRSLGSFILNRRMKKEFYSPPKEMVQEKEKMGQERTGALVELGFSRLEADRIVSESLKMASVYEVESWLHSTKSVFITLEQYGFSAGEAKQIVTAFPPILNKSPAEITQKLLGFEDEGRDKAEVISLVLRMPAILG